MAGWTPRRGAHIGLAALFTMLVSSVHAQEAVVQPKLLSGDAFTLPTVGLLDGCGVPDQAAVAIRVLSEIPGATNSRVPTVAPWCTRLDLTTPADPTSAEVVQIDQTDFVSNDGGKTLEAVGSEGSLGTLNTSAAVAEAKDSAPKTSFWGRFKRNPNAASDAAASAPTVDADAPPPVAPPAFTYVATPDMLLLARPGGIFAFDRHFRRFCPIGIAQPGVASQHAMYQISDGRVLVVGWSLPARDKPAVQSAVLIVPPSLCPPPVSGRNGG